MATLVGNDHSVRREGETPELVAKYLTHIGRDKLLVHEE